MISYTHLPYYLAYFLPHLLSLFYRRFSTVAFYHLLLSLTFIAYFSSLVSTPKKQNPTHLPPQAHGVPFISYPDIRCLHPISLHHLLHHFCLKLHHFPIKYDTFAFSPKVHKSLKTLVFQAFPKVLKRSKHKFNKLLLICFHTCVSSLF